MTVALHLAHGGIAYIHITFNENRRRYEVSTQCAIAARQGSYGIAQTLRDITNAFVEQFSGEWCTAEPTLELADVWLALGELIDHDD